MKFVHPYNCGYGLDEPGGDKVYIPSGGFIPPLYFVFVGPLFLLLAPKGDKIQT
jgi:hypothetical protein